MNLRQLYYFRTIAELEHYTQAAEKLYVSQSNLSHAIQEMEEELNVLLTQVLEAFYKIRSLPQIKKKPSTSEIIDWIQALVHGGVDPDRIVKEVPYLGVLLKKNEDMDALRRNWR